MLQQLVMDEGSSFPMASRSIMEHTYVDEIIKGADSASSAIQLHEELTQLLSLGGFALRKWASSHSEVLELIPAEHRETPIVFSADDLAIKILGVMWEPTSDVFLYHVENFDGTLTKRGILSYISRIFDPMGWLSPCVLGKTLLTRTVALQTGLG